MRDWSKEAKELTEKLYEIEKSDEQTRFYEDTVFPWTKERIEATHQPASEHQLDVLILSVGTSYEPIVLSILTLKPKNVVFLHTEDTKKIIDIVFKHIELAPTQFTRLEVDKVNMDRMYKSVQQVFREHKEKEKEEDSLHFGVDITGGTKAMSSGLAMAGTMIGATAFYIASDFDKTFKKAKPGSERVEVIPNPHAFWQDVNIERAKTMWEQKNFFGAHTLFSEMNQDDPTKIEYLFLSKIGLAYYEMENMNMEGAATCIESAISILDRHGENFTLFTDKNNLMDKLNGQLELVKRLNSSFRGTDDLTILGDTRLINDMLFFFYHLGNVRGETGRFDFAALYYYRMVEIVSQHRLATYGILTGNADYSQLSIEKRELLDKCNKISNRKFKNTFKGLGKQIPLLQGYIILTALDDPVVKQVNLKKLNHAISSRNTSILAHGYDQITEKKCEPIKSVAYELLQFINPDLTEENLSSRINEFQPVRLTR